MKNIYIIKGRNFITLKDFTPEEIGYLLELAEKYGIYYSGMVIEDYTEEVESPFVPNQNTQRFQYFGSALLKNGGEIGLHGYNHIPLCMEGFDADFGEGYIQGTYERLFDYDYWESEEDMRASVEELIRFTEDLYPAVTPEVYVPPSNILSADAREMLVREFPQDPVGRFPGDRRRRQHLL